MRKNEREEIATFLFSSNKQWEISVLILIDLKCDYNKL